MFANTIGCTNKFNSIIQKEENCFIVMKIKSEKKESLIEHVGTRKWKVVVE